MERIKKNIYFDHSATTPVDPRVFELMRPYFSQVFGNYSSLHSFGREAYFAVEQARESISKILNCQKDEVIFTSGSTESNNLAIKGLINTKSNKPLHVITTMIEHDSVLRPCKQLEQQGVRVTYLPVDRYGVVNPKDVLEAIEENTVLASIMYVNNEIGSINPIANISKIIKEKKKDIVFHVDATQAVNFLSCDVEELGIDMMSISSHKIYGPKGVGLLYVRNGIKLDPLQSGGHQEQGLRSGTINVSGIVGFGKAMEINYSEMNNNNKIILELRNYFINQVLEKIPNVVLNTDINRSVCSHASFCFVGAEGEATLLYLDTEGVAVSTGSACASGSLDPSHVLLAIGLKKEIAHSSIRFTFGKYNTKEEIDYAIEVLVDAVKKLRKMNPLYK